MLQLGAFTFVFGADTRPQLFNSVGCGMVSWPRRKHPHELDEDDTDTYVNTGGGKPTQRTVGD